ncbi:hypothetical protein IG631_12889 [Alternaria alternata]|nr:hypothetical protein IG631_12889 [Alternaria alternata]
MSFVKRTFKDSHGKLVDKLVEKAHILESNFANERLQALRNVAPGERMGHGDIFIAPPPDYDYQPSPTYLQVPSPRFVSHTRSQSDPVLSPGFSSSSTLNDPNDSPFNKKDRPTSFTFVREEKEVSSSAPEATSFLLPATTYDGGFSQRRERSASLYPGSSSDQHFERMNSERMISLLPLSPTTPAPPQDWNAPEHAPRISYTPEERPISFTFPFDPKHPFDRKSTSETSQSDQQNLLDDIDDAIDEFMYTLPAATYSPLPATTYSPQPTPEPILSSATYTPEPTLSSATYNPEATLTSAIYKPEPILSSAVYDPRHARKDSAMPSQDYADERPPVPLKDDKYRKGSLRG